MLQKFRYNELRYMILFPYRLAQFVVFGMTVLLGIIYYPRLPDVMASHFGANGQADDFMGKFGFYCLMLGITFVIFAGCRGLSRWIMTMDAKLLNMPNKDYWLAPERALESRMVMVLWFEKFGFWMQSFMFLTFWLALEAALKTPPVLNANLFLPLVLVFVVMSVYSSIRMTTKFKLPSQVP